MLPTYCYLLALLRGLIRSRLHNCLTFHPLIRVDVSATQPYVVICSGWPSQVTLVSVNALTLAKAKSKKSQSRQQPHILLQNAECSSVLEIMLQLEQNVWQHHGTLGGHVQTSISPIWGCGCTSKLRCSAYLILFILFYFIASALFIV